MLDPSEQYLEGERERGPELDFEILAISVPNLRFVSLLHPLTQDKWAIPSQKIITKPMSSSSKLCGREVVYEEGLTASWLLGEQRRREWKKAGSDLTF